MNWPRYVPNTPRIPGEYYNSFEWMKLARPDIFKGTRHGYHIERW